MNRQLFCKLICLDLSLLVLLLGFFLSIFCPFNLLTDLRSRRNIWNKNTMIVSISFCLCSIRLVNLNWLWIAVHYQTIIFVYERRSNSLCVARFLLFWLRHTVQCPTTGSSTGHSDGDIEIRNGEKKIFQRMTPVGLSLICLGYLSTDGPSRSWWLHSDVDRLVVATN